MLIIYVLNILQIQMSLSFIRHAQRDHLTFLGTDGVQAEESQRQPFSETTIVSHCESILNVTTT